MAVYQPNDPLARIAGESMKANTALSDYALLGKGRSLRVLAEQYMAQTEELPPTRSLATLERWSATYHWQARLADHERLLTQKQLAQREARQLAWEERAWSMANRLAERAEEMLKFPLVRTETKDGKAVVMPIRWTGDTISRYVQTADKLARLTTHTETDIQQVRLDLSSLPEGVSAEQMDEWVDEWAAGILAQIDRGMTD